MLTTGAGGYFISLFWGDPQVSESPLSSRSPLRSQHSWHGCCDRMGLSRAPLGKTNPPPTSTFTSGGRCVDTHSFTSISGQEHLAISNTWPSVMVQNTQWGPGKEEGPAYASHSRARRSSRSSWATACRWGLRLLDMARMRCRGRELRSSEANLEKTSGSRTTDWTSRKTWRHTSASGSRGKR